MRALAIVLVLAACSCSPTSAPVQLTNVTTTSAPSRGSFPTLADAGATTCRAAPVELGGNAARATFGFDEAGGLVSWAGLEKLTWTLKWRTIARNGTALGPLHTMDSELGLAASRIYAIPTGFVVILRGWDFSIGVWHSWIVVLDRAGEVTRPMVEFAAGESSTLWAAQRLDDHRIALILAHSSGPVELDGPGQWYTFAIGDDGSVAASAPRVLALAGLEGKWEPAMLAGARGWAIVRDGATLHDGVFDGVRTSAVGATLDRPRDAIVTAVTNLDPSPPRGAGARPSFARSLAGRPVGDPLVLMADGVPIDHFNEVFYTVEWSGAVFLYPFYLGTNGPMRLLAIDCHP